MLAWTNDTTNAATNATTAYADAIDAYTAAATADEPAVIYFN